MTKQWWGVDPGTANMAAVLIEGTEPIVVIDIVTKPATKGGKKTAPKPKMLWLRVWTGRCPVLKLDLMLPADAVDAVDMIDRAFIATTGEGAAIESLITWLGDGATVERIVGNIAPDLADAGGIVAGLLWARTGGERPQRPTAAKWRKAMLDIPGDARATEAERVAVAMVREIVPGWPATASGHAAEAYWIARWGAEVCDGK